MKKTIAFFQKIGSKFVTLKDAFFCGIQGTGTFIKNRTTKVANKGGNVIISLKKKFFKKAEVKENSILLKSSKIDRIKKDLKGEKDQENNAKKEDE